MSKIIVTIDGPAASGKGVTAARIARRFQLVHIDSGACYRAVAWLALQHRIPLSPDYHQQISQMIDQAPITMADDNSGGLRVLVGDQDITDQIRDERISQAASVIGSMTAIRQHINALQRRIFEASAGGVVAEGRDTGSVVFPEAHLKIFLTALPEVRARRRQAQYAQRGQDLPFEQVLASMKERDHRDSSRAYSALRVSEDAVVIDTSDLSVEEVVAKISRLIEPLLSPS